MNTVICLQRASPADFHRLDLPNALMSRLFFHFAISWPKKSRSIVRFTGTAVIPTRNGNGIQLTEDQIPHLRYQLSWCSRPEQLGERTRRGPGAPSCNVFLPIRQHRDMWALHGSHQRIYANEAERPTPNEVTWFSESDGYLQYRETIKQKVRVHVHYKFKNEITTYMHY